MPGSHTNSNLNWDTSGRTWEAIQVTVLMDIRSELQTNNAELRKLNAVFGCPNFTAIPAILRMIRSDGHVGVLRLKRLLALVERKRSTKKGRRKLLKTRAR